MKSFIAEYMNFSRDLESPTSFFLWGCLSCIGAALRDNVYLRQGHRKLYPNIYVLLLADSGISRKSVPLGLTGDLLKQVGTTKIIRGRSSIQAILQDLASPQMNKKTGAQVTGGSGLLCAEELASFFVQDPAAVPILTDIYDFRDEWEYNLKGSGRIIINNLCVSMLAASNETHLREVYTNTAVYGGLMGRTFFVKSSERRKPNALVDDMVTVTANGHYDITPLGESLKEITKIKGKFLFEDESRKEYTKWYEDLYSKYSEHNDKSGIMARIHTGVLKVAMILAVGNDYELVIRKTHILEAIDICIKLKSNYEVFAMATGKAPDSQIGALLFGEILNSQNGKISRRWFIRNNWTNIDEDTFDTLIKKLETSNLIKTDFDGGDFYYSLTDFGREKLEEKRRQKLAPK
jgi:predicted transcriptional regulator